ncbi:23S rRNA (adenine(1618)-N(6))-methyltransferase RlmF [Opitutales bacterium ASA1]|uniref:23S rRNA (adenine(1618)-N(6))-methyltransferase RlmF n=1 Tax=Congregicoccus parvus TaxID=3081749 RepID=UPI002B2B78B9|nr:23S rRNA (adenine(1618)-N(6))-methyltransferase RlmF [Opitutales bacterium ASA1]
MRNKTKPRLHPSDTGPVHRATRPLPERKEELHPRNRFNRAYDFARLVEAHFGLKRHVVRNRYGHESVNYADPSAVKALNRALLADAYGLKWDLPPGRLCPAVPGRLDYLHHLADLLAEDAREGGPVSILDVGTGANCIYPLVGASEFGWRFVGVDVDTAAVRWARKLLAANPATAARIELRVQPSRDRFFRGVIGADERFDATVCNPPFHASAAAAAAGTRRKAENLRGRAAAAVAPAHAGVAGELWCPGGEAAFLRGMIRESAAIGARCRWFTALVSRSDHLDMLYRVLEYARATRVRTIAMAHGAKRSRILAWTFRPSDVSAGRGRASEISTTQKQPAESIEQR